MLKGVGLAFLTLIGGMGIAILSSVMGSGFPVDYARNDSIAVLSTILALNFATATFLVGSMLNIEEKTGEDTFLKPRKELSQNIKVMSVLLGLNILTVSSINPAKGIHLFGSNILLSDALATVTLAILLFYIALLLEVITAAIALRVPRK